MIYNFINSIKTNQKILVSYSGGLDSTVLLYQLIPFIKKKPFIKLRAIHINHQINKKSHQWSKHCQEICLKNNILLIIKKIKINTKQNIQAHARKLRYQKISEIMFSDEILVTGHHCNDQCETLFLSLKRGSGIPGLSGIAKTKLFDQNKKIIRPLLGYQKKELQIWAIKNNIQWVEDDSNYDNKYDRNFIRNHVISPIQKKWPFFIKNCSRSMELCYQQTIAINYFLDQIIKNLSLFKDSLKIIKIHIYPKEVQILLIRRWISINSNNNISYITTKNISYNLLHHKNNITKNVHIKHAQIKKYQDTIFYIPEYRDVKNMILFWFHYNKPLKLPDNIGYIIQNDCGISLPKPNKNDLVNIRFQLSKNININTYNIKTKNIWQKNKVTPWNRNRIPSLFYNNKLITIMGFAINCKKKYSKTWKLSWVNLI